MKRQGKQELQENSAALPPPLPPGWCWSKVGEVGEVRLGRQRSPQNRAGKYPTKYLRAANITWNGLDLSDGSPDCAVVIPETCQPASSDFFKPVACRRIGKS